MFSFPSSNNHFQSSSESGDSLSDSFLDTEVSLESHTKRLMAGDFALGLGSPPFISPLDEDVPDFERHNDSNTREIFLASPPYGEPGHLPKTNFFQPELPSPSQLRYKSSQQAGDGTYISRLNHYLPQLITENLNSTVDTSVLETSSIGCAPEPNSATSTTISSCEESPHYRTEHLSGSSKDPQNDHSPRPRKTRREKPHIELAPDQPPTTQGKPRARVYVACVQCRTRKIRCDGAKPTCHNCSRRTTSNGGSCSYDSAPKRRGPDKMPGARQRNARDASQGVDNDIFAVRRRRRRRETSFPSKSGSRAMRKHTADPYECLSLTDTSSPVSPAPVTPISPLTEESSEVWSSLMPARGFTVLSHARPTVNNSERFFSPCQDYDEPAFTLIGGLGRGYRDCENINDHEDHKTFNIVAEPSLDFIRKTWWDSLLSIYSSSSTLDPLALSNTQREYAASHVTSDLRYLFRFSNYWFSFFHVPRFFGTFFDPVARDRMQPSLILAACALATFWQSSEIGRGKYGRDLALRLRDEAGGALQASLDAGWVDETLAQAAWMLAVFEICAHPLHSSHRSTSSMLILDQIIHTLSLTSIDSDDPNASVFASRAVPQVNPEQKAAQQASWHVPSQSIGSPQTETITSVSHSTHHNSRTEPIMPTEGCNCAALSLGQQWASAFEHTPLWLSTPAWDANWTEGEIRKESCRRLCWSGVLLAAGHSSYTTANNANGLDLFITDPANYRLLFPGEALTPSRCFKDSIWALNYRTMLLWHACVRMRHDVHATDVEKARFGTTAWLEVDLLEQALNGHKCGLERSFLFQGREYLFNTRMCISYEFQRYIPLTTADVRALFHHKKAEEWLTHQATVAKQVMHGLHTVTGQAGGGSLTQRPFFVFWFMSQVSRALSVWKCDTSLSSALDVCRALLSPIDYLTALWPCPEQRTRYQRLREQLDEACVFAGLPLPDPPNLTIPTSRSSIPISTSSVVSAPLVVSSWGQNYETADPIYARTTGIA